MPTMSKNDQCRTRPATIDGPLRRLPAGDLLAPNAPATQALDAFQRRPDRRRGAMREHL